MPRSPTEFIAVDTGLEVAGQVVALHGSLVFGVAFPQIWFPLGLPQRDPQLQATHAITITHGSPGGSNDLSAAVSRGDDADDSARGQGAVAE